MSDSAASAQRAWQSVNDSGLRATATPARLPGYAESCYWYSRDFIALFGIWLSLDDMSDNDFRNTIDQRRRQMKDAYVKPTFSRDVFDGDEEMKNICTDSDE